MSAKAKPSKRRKAAALTTLQREAAVRDAVVASEEQKRLRAEFLARNPGALA